MKNHIDPSFCFKEEEAKHQGGHVTPPQGVHSSSQTLPTRTSNLLTMPHFLMPISTAIIEEDLYLKS